LFEHRIRSEERRNAHRYRTDGVLVGAEAFALERGKTGCLLIHGFPGNPAEMRSLGESLAEKGISVRAVRLPGSGTNPLDLRRRKWEEWYQAGEQGLAELRKSCDTAIVVGFSTGGLVALNLAVQHEVDGVVCLSTFMYPRNKAAYAGSIPVVNKVIPFLLRYVPTGRSLTARKGDTQETNAPAYSYMPLRAGVEILEYARVTRRKLHEVHEPLLVIQSRADRVVAPKSANFICRSVASKDRQLRWLAESGHPVMLDVEREQVVRWICAFVQAQD